MRLYERVTINRKNQTVEADRLDGNWWNESPFLGRRDLIYVENREDDNSKNGQLTFVRHVFWLHTMCVMGAQLNSSYSAWSLKRSLAITPSSAQ